MTGNSCLWVRGRRVVRLLCLRGGGRHGGGVCHPSLATVHASLWRGCGFDMLLRCTAADGGGNGGVSCGLRSRFALAGSPPRLDGTLLH